MKIKSIIIDDELMARKLLGGLIQEFCPEVEVLAQCENLPEAIKAIKKHKPDLIFLDIEMPGYSGLDILDFFDESEVTFSIIFTTAYNQFAIQAIKLSAVDYLLKPIDSEELIKSIDRFVNFKNKLNYSLIKEINTTKELKKIAISDRQSTKIINLEDIIYLRGDGSYTFFILANNQKILSSKNLKHFEDVLKENTDFIRCHKSFIVNMNHIVELSKTDGFFVVVNNDDKISVSPDKYSFILDMINLK